MKYKVGDKVRVKSLEWYNKNKDADNHVKLIGNNNGSYNFIKPMSEYCGQIVTICGVDNVDEYYDIMDDNGDYFWTDEMFEKQAENYNKYRLDECDDDKLATEATIDGDKITPPENYLIGKITKVDNGMLVEFVKKQPQYPKTYEECCRTVNANPNIRLTYDLYSGQKYSYDADNLQHYKNIRKLLICRDAYWKIAGKQMGLGKPFEPDWNDTDSYYTISYKGLQNVKLHNDTDVYALLSFPTKEMQDTFFENFKELIEQCKMFL